MDSYHFGVIHYCEFEILMARDLFGEIAEEIEPDFLAFDVFCGAGGSTYGMIEAGGYVIAGIDRNSCAEKTFLCNNKNKSYREDKPQHWARNILSGSEFGFSRRDLVEAEIDIALKQAKEDFPNLPVLFFINAPDGSYDSGSVSKVRAKKEARNLERQLIISAVEIAVKFNADSIILENETGVSKKKFENVWGRVKRNLEESGYSISSNLINAKDFGVPQDRQRNVMLAVKRSRAKTKIKSLLPVPEKWPGVGDVFAFDALSHFPKVGAGERNNDFYNHHPSRLSEISTRRLSLAEPGGDNSYLKEYGLEVECYKRMSEKIEYTTGVDVYTRIHPEKAAPTITSDFLMVSRGRFGHYDTRQVRGLSVREGAALQSFPDNYRFFPDNRRDFQARQVASSTPPKVAKLLSMHIMGALQK